MFNTCNYTLYSYITAISCMGHVLKLIFVEGHIVPFKPVDHIMDVAYEKLDIALALNGD